MASYGYQNERDIIELLNGKEIKDVPEYFSGWLNKLFNDAEGKMVVNKLNTNQKADIRIRIGKVSKYISIKCGDDNEFHSEKINAFIPFLRSIGVSNFVLKHIILFHWGDNTLDGTGRTRFTSEEIRRVNRDVFLKVNRELKNHNIIKKVIKRCIIQGREKTNKEIDGIYHGTVRHGFFITKAQIYKILMRKSYSRYNGTINISKLTYQSGSRNLYRNPELEVRRQNSTIKWRTFIQDATFEIEYGYHTDY